MMMEVTSPSCLILLLKRQSSMALVESKRLTRGFLQIAMKEGEKAQFFPFARIWASPRTILSLSVEPPAFKNISILVADAALSEEDLLIGFTVLKHFEVETRTLLEQRSDDLDGDDCSDVQHRGMSDGSAIGCLMIARQDGIVTKENGTIEDRSELQAEGKRNRYRMNYFDIIQDQDPFPKKSLLDPIDSDQHGDVVLAVEEMVQQAKKEEWTYLIPRHVFAFYLIILTFSEQGCHRYLPPNYHL